MKPETVTLVVGILAPVLSGLITFLGILATNSSKDKVRDAETKAAMDAIRKDINRLEQKQDAHNTLIERMYGAEKAISVLQEQVRELEHN